MIRVGIWRGVSGAWVGQQAGCGGNGRSLLLGTLAARLGALLPQPQAKTPTPLSAHDPTTLLMEPGASLPSCVLSNVCSFHDCVSYLPAGIQAKWCRRPATLPF